jgi:ATP-dependent protease ClpP protease subunit
MEIYLIGSVGQEITLEKLVNQTKNLKVDEVLNLYIHSEGGSVYEGLAIYNHLKQLPNEVNTHSSGLVASIASVFFLAGKNRTASTVDNFLIHLPFSMAQGNAAQMEKTAKELREVEQKLAGIYAMETDLTPEEAIELMKKDEFLDSDFLKSKNFVTEIKKYQAVATINKLKMTEQFTKEEATGMFARFEQKILKALKLQPKNKIVFDAEGVEIDFYELADDEAVQVGAKARVKGSNADGVYRSVNNETWTFENGELISIEPAQTEVEVLTQQNEALQAKIEQLESEKEELSTTISNQTEDLKAVKQEFFDFKSEITSKFEASLKNPKPEPNKSRTLNLKKK